MSREAARTQKSRCAGELDSKRLAAAVTASAEIERNRKLSEVVSKWEARICDLADMVGLLTDFTEGAFEDAYEPSTKRLNISERTRNHLMFGIYHLKDMVDDFKEQFCKAIDATNLQ